MLDFLKKKEKPEQELRGINNTYAFLVYCYQDPKSGEFKFEMQSAIYENLFEKYPRQQATDLKLTYNMFGAYLHEAVESVRAWYTRPFDEEKVKMAFQFGDKLPTDKMNEVEAKR
jgi:hypothetical protein